MNGHKREATSLKERCELTEYHGRMDIAVSIGGAVADPPSPEDHPVSWQSSRSPPPESQYTPPQLQPPDPAS